MCAHIHRVASLKGAPSSEYVDPTVAGADTLGLQEALNRLQNLNRRERLKPLEPLINELFQLMKVCCIVSLPSLCKVTTLLFISNASS